MNYQLIALDMDGTLLDTAKRVRQSSVDAIERALAAGRDVAICSGRCPAMVERHRADLPGVRYAICSSGATLYDLEERRVLSARSFDPSLVALLRELSAGLDFTPDAFSGRDFFYDASVLDAMDAYGVSEYESLFREAGQPVPDVWERALVEGTRVEKVDLHFSNHADRTAMIERVQGLPLELANSDSLTLEVSPAGVNKGVGLSGLADILGVPIEGTIAVGDSDNDLPMLRVAGLAVAMGNANERVRAAADVTVADNDHDGVADAIERLLLGGERARDAREDL
ncbi:MAG TPA: Cof-type HAD-IIB family hydrolase [Candidatus Olsenella pullistercoris]|uniref:Cof-type HAD-IIB family hydrolase n=1 Tax=Candidatus Olsenella pullistercoris TaxID=2838712 RepID=A0A9D2JE52_9ACTN|nr:Cof-type HAD-IIB family hydrolase [Candidatus Olsenella pullistercoris]